MGAPEMAVVIGLERWSVGWRLMAIRAQQEAKVDSSSYECCFHFFSSFFLKIFNFIFFLFLLLFWNQIFRINWVKIESENWSILEKMQNQDQELFSNLLFDMLFRYYEGMETYFNTFKLYWFFQYWDHMFLYYILNYRVNHNQAPCNMGSV